MCSPESGHLAENKRTCDSRRSAEERRADLSEVWRGWLACVVLLLLLHPAIMSPPTLCVLASGRQREQKHKSVSSLFSSDFSSEGFAVHVCLFSDDLDDVRDLLSTWMPHLSHSVAPPSSRGPSAHSNVI